MLLQTNSYLVPADKREAHARLMRLFQEVLLRLGCEHFEVYERLSEDGQRSAAAVRYVQLMRFRDRRHHQAHQEAERGDETAQQLIREFSHLVGLPEQLEHGTFTIGYYDSLIADQGQRKGGETPAALASPAD
jgi:hypothetical protein